MEIDRGSDRGEVEGVRERVDYLASSREGLGTISKPRRSAWGRGRGTGCT